MSQAPSMPLFCDAYLGDTKHLTLEEHGAYLIILMVTWTHNGVPLPDNDKRMARILGITIRRWREKIRPSLAPLFDLSDGFFRQKRLEKEWNYVSILRCKQSEKGFRSAEVKRLKKLETSSTAVAQRRQPNVNRTSTPIPIPIKNIENPNGFSPANPALRKREIETEFERDFWKAYPRKRDKGHALKAFIAARKSTDLATIVGAVERYALEVAAKEPEFIPYPATWLNGQRWTDEILAQVNGHHVLDPHIDPATGKPPPYDHSIKD